MEDEKMAAEACLGLPPESPLESFLTAAVVGSSTRDVAREANEIENYRNIRTMLSFLTMLYNTKQKTLF